MNNKNTTWFQHFLFGGKIIVTLFTVIIYFHYFSHQSWGYFTIDPKQPLMNIYAESSPGVVSKEPVLKNNTSYGMGMSRKGIFLYNKLADIIAADKSLAWKKLNPDSLASVTKNASAIPVINYNNCNIGRGRFVITKTGRESFGASGERKNTLPVTYYTITDIR